MICPVSLSGSIFFFFLVVAFCKSIVDYHHQDIDMDVIHLSHSDFPFVCVLNL